MAAAPLSNWGSQTGNFLVLFGNYQPQSFMHPVPSWYEGVIIFLLSSLCVSPILIPKPRPISFSQLLLSRTRLSLAACLYWNRRAHFQKAQSETLARPSSEVFGYDKP